MSRWKVIEWDNEQSSDSDDAHLSDDDNLNESDESPRYRGSRKGLYLSKAAEARGRLAHIKAKSAHSSASPYKYRESPVQRTLREIRVLWPAALVPIILLGAHARPSVIFPVSSEDPGHVSVSNNSFSRILFWCWNYCYLSNLDGRKSLDLEFLDRWTELSSTKLSEDVKRMVESKPLQQLRTWEEADGGSLVLADGAFLDGSHVEVVGYQWNTTFPLGKMWDSMTFDVYKWNLDPMLSVSCIFEKGKLLSLDSPVAAQVLPRNDIDWISGGDPFRRLFVIICQLPRETRNALRYLSSPEIPQLDLQIIIQQRTPRGIMEYNFPRLTIPLMPIRPYKLSFATMVRDHAKFLPEWLIFNFESGGFDHAYILDHFSKDNITGVLQPFIKAGLVTLIKAPLEMPYVPRWYAGQQALVQPTAFAATMSRYRYQTEWLAVFDVDEFLWSRPGNILSEELDRLHNTEKKDQTLVTRRFKYKAANAKVLSKSIHFTRDVAHADIHTARSDWHPLFPGIHSKTADHARFKFVTYNCQYWMHEGQECPAWRQARTNPPFVYENMMDAYQKTVDTKFKWYYDEISRT